MSSPKRLLVVEDDAELGENLGEILNGLGAETLVVDSAERALELCESHELACVITDLRLPGIDGIELLRRLRERGAAVPVVVISALAEPGVVAEAEASGALDVMNKPVDLERLAKLVEVVSTPRREVLIVEDNEALAENVYEALESSGIPSTVGATAEAALAQRGLPRVALVDLMLPDEDGLEVARRLCARDPTIRIIFVTAYADELLSRVTADQVPALIVKPFDLAELVARVRDAMAEPR